MKNIVPFLLITLLCANNLKAQIKLPKANLKVTQLPEDSLLKEFQNTVYYTFYNPTYMQTTVPTFTMLKIDIDGTGKIAGIDFSDSADPSFTKAWSDKKNVHDDKATLQQYAKIKGYYNVSLLMPVSYQPNYPNQKKVFTNGKAILLEPINIVVLSKGNM
jgi:hypothetical protein